MKVTGNILFLFMLGLPAYNCFAQDYFDDIKGNGNPISLNLAKTFNISARLNVGDNSAKANIFKMFHVQYKNGRVTGNKVTWTDATFPKDEANILNNLATPEDFSNSVAVAVPKSTFQLIDLGFGGSVKGKVKDGLGNIFSKSQFSGESQFALYGVFHTVKIVEDIHKHTVVVSPFINFNYSAVRIISDTITVIHKFDSTLKTTNYGISGFIKSYIKQSQLITGLSITRSKQNNYDDLTKVELKEFATRSNPPINSTITTIEDKGYTYGLGQLKVYRNTNVKVYATYIPFSLEYRAAVIFYPSVDFNKLYKKPLYNTGLGFHFLEKGNPSISNLGIFFELLDMNNAKEKTDPFIKRSFKMGISAALNVTSLIKKEK